MPHGTDRLNAQSKAEALSLDAVSIPRLPGAGTAGRAALTRCLADIYLELRAQGLIDRPGAA